MPAQDIRTLYKLRFFAEPALASALTSQQLPGLPPDSVFISREAEQRATPCVSVAFRLGPVNGHKFNPPTLNYWVFDQWQVNIELELRTNRGTNSEQHDDFEATIRYCLADVFTNVNRLLDYHAFGEPPRDVQVTHAVDSENKHDYTTLSFSTIFAIKRDAWPTA